MEVVLNNLQGQTPAQVLDALNRADVALDKDADTGDKTRNILRCIDYSHGNLALRAVCVPVPKHVVGAGQVGLTSASDGDLLSYLSRPVAAPGYGSGKPG